jgi:hypothetical protein
LLAIALLAAAFCAQVRGDDSKARMARRCELGATSGSTPGCSIDSRAKRSPCSIGFSGSISMTSRDGSLHKAPYGGGGTGTDPTDRGKLGWKWSVASERHGVPIGWVIDGANRHDVRMLEPTLDAVREAGLFADITTLHLDRGYDSAAVRDRLRRAGIGEFELQLRGTKVPGVKKQPVRLGLRWIVERPTRGGRSTASSDATPTADHGTVTPRCVSRPPSSSSGLIDWRNQWSPT